METKLSLIKKIPVGYKQTEIGVIPEDWDVKTLGEIGETYGGLSGKKKSDFDGGKYPYIPFMNIMSNPVIDLQYFDYVNIRGDEKQNRAIKGDLFFNGSSETPEEVGMCSVLQGDIPNLYLNSFCFGFRLNKDLKTDGLYLSYFFRSPMGRQLIFSLAQGATRYNLSKINFMKLEIPYPDPVEQIAIATVLSDTDALIEHLEKLIAKKKAIKQGAMQQLLTGKMRLPGFSGDWDVKTLGEIGETYGGLSGKKKSDFDGGKYPYIPFMNIMSNPVIDLQYFDYVNIRGDEKQNRAIKGDLFFNGSSETPEEVGMCSVLQGDIPNLYLNSFCFGFRLNKDLKTDGLYLSYFFRSPMGRQLIFSLAQGATRYNLSKINFMKLEIPYPDPAKQITIAKIFSDMDAEIKSLEQKRDKYTMLKQGMMQQLLTGRIRIYANK